MSDKPDDAFQRALRMLPPDARDALRRSLLGALERGTPPAEPPVYDRVNTTIEVLHAGPAEDAVTVAIGRAAREGERAPVVRLDAGEHYALLVSPQLVWRLAERVDELALALAVLATAWVRSQPDRDRLEDVLDRLDA